MNRSQRRSVSGGIGPHRLHRMGTTKSLSHTQGTTDLNPSIYRAIQGSGMPIHGYTMHHTKAHKSHKFPATGHCHLQ